MIETLLIIIIVIMLHLANSLIILRTGVGRFMNQYLEQEAKKRRGNE